MFLAFGLRTMRVSNHKYKYINIYYRLSPKITVSNHVPIKTQSNLDDFEHKEYLSLCENTFNILSVAKNSMVRTAVNTKQTNIFKSINEP